MPQKSLHMFGKPVWVCSMAFLVVGPGSLLARVWMEEEIEINGRGHVTKPANESFSRVLLSMTTTLHLPGKEEFVERALESVLLHHPDHHDFISRWFLINEFSEDGGERALSALENISQRFPHVDIYQKRAHERGQARSLNTILDLLRSGNYDYWLHIEESWQITRPFLAEALESMDSHPYLHQLQIYHAAYYLSHTHTRITKEVEVIALNSNVDLTTADPRNWRSYSLSWPAYSLRPSLTRVAFLRDHPELVFDTDPTAFPVIFEFDFAINWTLQGGTMCALVYEAVVRQEGHRSTYTLDH